MNPAVYYFLDLKTDTQIAEIHDLSNISFFICRNGIIAYSSSAWDIMIIGTSTFSIFKTNYCMVLYHEMPRLVLISSSMKNMHMFFV